MLDLVIIKGCTVSEKLLGYAEQEFIKRYLVAHKIFTYAQEPRPEGLQSGAMPTSPPTLLGRPLLLLPGHHSRIHCVGAGCQLCHLCLCREWVCCHFLLNACFWGTCPSWPPASESNSAIESSWWMCRSQCCK